ncbi:MAG TPA: YdcF family protein [Planctomycetota bacterium]|nr:YdcF family protein [Planctomycetota bacterium]
MKRLAYAAVSALKTLASLPGVLILPLLAGALLLRRSKRAGWSVIALTLALAWAFSTPFVGAGLLRALQTSPPIAPDVGRAALRAQADAIVVLAAEQRPVSPEFPIPAVGPMTLERLRYAAALARRSGLSVCTSGGVPQRGAPSLADAMAEVLEHDYGVTVRWREGRSADSRGNAIESAALLAPDGVQRVYVVTHAWHMPRALQAFRQAGLEPIAAPTAFRGPAHVTPRSFWPSARGMAESALAWHELLGLVYYRLRP